MTDRILLGAHMSIRGGVHMAFERGERAGCTTMQVFTGQTNRWTGRGYSANEVRDFKSAAIRTGINPIVAHASYLINLCAVDKEILSRSRLAMKDELSRCEQLGILGLIVHPGAHLGTGEAEGIKQIAKSLNIVHSQTHDLRALTILETTAGQGSALGYRFGQLRAIIDLVEYKDRVAVCADTCHLFAAGYDIRTERGWGFTMQEFDKTLGLHRLAVIHVNDSQKDLGSRVDRHEHIGRGRIGVLGFQLLMRDPRLSQVPKILETKKSEDLHEDIENIRLLRSLMP